MVSPTPAAGKTALPKSRLLIVGPISAQFLGETAKATDYHVLVTLGAINPNETLQYTVQWAGPNCGSAAPTGLQHQQQVGPTTEAFSVGYTMRWSHPHPDCAPNTSDADVTIYFTVSVGTETYVCVYQGAESGTGKPCVKQ